LATLARSEMADRALRALGILAAGQNASSEDANRAMEAVDTVYYSMRKEGLAPFAVSAWPEWAQSAAAHLVALELAPTFGISGARLGALTTLAAKGRSDLATQMFGKRHPVAIKADYF
jgi:hypothetical protein